jgi:hypothetical protein
MARTRTTHIRRTSIPTLGELTRDFIAKAYEIQIDLEPPSIIPAFGLAQQLPSTR